MSGTEHKCENCNKITRHIFWKPKYIQEPIMIETDDGFIPMTYNLAVIGHCPKCNHKQTLR